MFLIAILAVSTISVVTAADITINSTTPGGIKAAVGSAKDGDTIFLKDGVYKGKDNAKISISKSITIKGLGSNLVLDGEGKNRIFTIRGNKILLKKLQLRQGYTKHHGGIILHKKGSLILNNCIFNNNKADKYGGSVNSEKKLVWL